MEDCKTYDSTGAKEVCCATGSSGIDKRSCTAQLKTFADGSVLPPLLIFKGEGKRIMIEEKRRWDIRVFEEFQQKTWCDKKVMIQWISTQWGNVLLNRKTLVSNGKILFVHTVQQTDSVKLGLQKKDAILINVPSGTTSRVQLLDVCIKKLFKCYIREQFEKHL